MINMKSIALGLILVLFLSGCAGMPDIFGGLGGGNNINKTELASDLIVIQNLNVIPSPPINAKDTFSVSFEIKNQDDLKEVNNVRYSLFDSGICGEPTGSDKESLVGNAGSLAPLETDFYQWNFQAPDNNAINNLPTSCPIRFKVNYSYVAESQADVGVISKTRLEQLQRAGNTPSFTPSNAIGRGPIKIYFTFSSDMPVKSNNTISTFLNVIDKGTGLYGEIGNYTLFINFPEKFTLIDEQCGPKFNCAVGSMSDYCKKYSGQADLLEKILCDANKDGKIDSNDINALPKDTTGCINIEEIPIIKKSSPQIRCTVTVPDIEDEKTYYLSASLAYGYDVNGETSVDIKPILT